MTNNDIYVRDWMAKCKYVNPQVVGKNGGLEYGIYPGSMNTIYRENVLGERVPAETQEMIFIFTAKRVYALQSDYGFFTNIVKWIDTQNKLLNFPQINEGVVKSIVPEMTQYVSEPNRGEERCQINITIYYKPYNT